MLLNEPIMLTHKNIVKRAFLPHALAKYFEKKPSIMAS